MRFTVSDRFDASIERVEQAVLSGPYQERLRSLPNVAEREVRLQEEAPGGLVRRVVRYRFDGHVPSAVRSAIGADTISWDERAVYDPAKHEWRFEIDPHVAKGRFSCRGTYRFSPEDGGGTRRDVDVDIEVKVPFVGGAVEAAIAGGLRDTLSAEHRILTDYLSENDT